MINMATLYNIIHVCSVYCLSSVIVLFTADITADILSANPTLWSWSSYYVQR